MDEIREIILSLEFQDDGSTEGGGRDSKKDYWMLLRNLRLELFDKQSTKLYSHAKLLEQEKNC